MVRKLGSVRKRGHVHMKVNLAGYKILLDPSPKCSDSATKRSEVRLVFVPVWGGLIISHLDTCNIFVSVFVI